MSRPLLLAALFLPASVWAQINAAANLEVPNPPLRANAVFNGLMLRNETEFLTPEGILDTLPPEVVLQPVVPAYATLEPAAGPESPAAEVTTTEVPASQNPSAGPTPTTP